MDYLQMVDLLLNKNDFNREDEDECTSASI